MMASGKVDVLAQLEEINERRRWNRTVDLIKLWPYHYGLNRSVRMFEDVTEVGVTIRLALSDKVERITVEWLDVELAIRSLPMIEQKLIRAVYWCGRPRSEVTRLLKISKSDYYCFRDHAVWHVAKRIGILPEKNEEENY